MDNAAYAIIAVGFLLLLFLVGRDIVCWYFKINKIVELLEEIKDSLKK